jgi:hypothetical protein
MLCNLLLGSQISVENCRFTYVYHKINGHTCFKSHLAPSSISQILSLVTHKFGNYNSLWDTNTAVPTMYINYINPKQNSGDLQMCVTSISVSDTEEGAKYVP